jgi:hypothetical protein
VGAVFADAFHWVGLTNPDDSGYQDALSLDSVFAETTIITTGEILAEFMTFFSADQWQTGGHRNRAPSSERAGKKSIFGSDLHIGAR